MGGEEFREAFFQPGGESTRDAGIERGVNDFVKQKMSLVIGLLLRLHPDGPIEMPAGVVRGDPVGEEFQFFEFLLVLHEIADNRSGVVDKRGGRRAEKLIDDADELIDQGRKRRDVILREVGIDRDTVRCITMNSLLG